MRASAFAKINLALAVFPRMADGFHPLRGIFQSVSLADTVELSAATDDVVTVSNDEAPADAENLAWKALESVRRATRTRQPMSIHLDKRIPAGAGLGGGSADAAAVLGLAGGLYGMDEEQLATLAEGLGSDVPFALRGGTCQVEGTGERLTDLEPLSGVAIAIVVPPITLATPDVYRAWDELDGPTAPTVPDDDLPPTLRSRFAIRNDLFPAANHLDPRVGEWRDELSHRWSTSVLMTGSGSALFAFFPTEDEAASAAAGIDLPTRLASAATPVDRGWERIDG